MSLYLQISSLLYRNTRSIEAGAQKKLMVDSTGNLKLISYLFPFQENACMPCSELGREAFQNPASAAVKGIWKGRSLPQFRGRGAPTAAPRQPHTGHGNHGGCCRQASTAAAFLQATRREEKAFQLLHGHLTIRKPFCL